MKKSAMMVNITWNRTGWTGIDINKDAGHKKVRDAPGHESLNFDFDKKGIDDKTWVHGYFQTHKTPICFEDGGLIFFYSQDPQTQKKFFVGVYGSAKVFDKKEHPIEKIYGHGGYWTNICGKKEMSLRFSDYVEIDKSWFKKRMGQVSYAYLDDEDASRILDRAIKQCEKDQDDELRLLQLKLIYEASSQKNYDVSYEDIQERENTDEGIMAQKIKKRGHSIDPEKFLTAAEPRRISAMHYPRSPGLSAFMKDRNNHTCQICKVPTFQTSHGIYYTESHHILPRSKGGDDKPENIVVVCSNCHRLFHNGSKSELVRAYTKLKESKAFADFDALKERDVITKDVYDSLMSA